MMKDYLATINFLKKRAYYFDGLVVAIVFCVGITSLVAQNNLPQGWLPTIYLTELIVIVAGWCLMRRLPKFKPTEIGILFAAHSKDEIKEELDTLFDEVSSLLKNHKAGNLINIKKLPEHITVNNIELATNIRIKSRCVLLIWGRYEKGPIKNKEYKGFLPNKLNFTYITPDSRIGRI